MELAKLPVFERLASAKSVLIAGAGGGFDVFAGLPLYAALRKRGTAVHLANLSVLAESPRGSSRSRRSASYHFGTRTRSS